MKMSQIKSYVFQGFNEFILLVDLAPEDGDFRSTGSGSLFRVQRLYHGFGLLDVLFVALLHPVHLQVFLLDGILQIVYLGGENKKKDI